MTSLNTLYQIFLALDDEIIEKQGYTINRLRIIIS
jgi:hypothetical protein